MAEIYMVQKQGGAYEERYTIPVMAFKDEARALAYAQEQMEEHRRVEKEHEDIRWRFIAWQQTQNAPCQLPFPEYPDMHMVDGNYVYDDSELEEYVQATKDIKSIYKAEIKAYYDIWYPVYVQICADVGYTAKPRDDITAITGNGYYPDSNFEFTVITIPMGD